MNDAILDRLDAMQAWVHRRRWWIRGVSLVVLVLVCWPFVSSRWNAQPDRAASSTVSAFAAFDQAVFKPPTEVDNTSGVTQALLALPADPILAAPTTAPAGFEWVRWQDWRKRQGTDPSTVPKWWPTTPVFDVSEALDGDWLPEQRYHLSAIIKHLESPATSRPLDRLRDEAGRPFCLDPTSFPSGLAVFRQAAKMLTARARYQLAQHKEFDEAIRDIETVLFLSDGMVDDGTLIRGMVAVACRSLALEEIRSWPEEFSLNSEQLEVLAKLLEAHPFNGRAAWTVAMQGEMRGFENVLDTMYTQSPGGGGFLVQARPQNDEPVPWALGVLNLLSPLFEDRRRAEELIALNQGSIVRSADLEPDALRQIMNRAPQMEFRPVLGPTWVAWGLPVEGTAGSFAQSLMIGIGAQVGGDLCATVIALNRYRKEHGAYPDQLSMLVPKYLPEVPIDLFSGQPLKYRSGGKGDYLLYSVDEDGHDNGGRERRPTTQEEEEFDRVATRRRGEPPVEWILVSKDKSADRSGGVQK